MAEQLSQESSTEFSDIMAEAKSQLSLEDSGGPDALDEELTYVGSGMGSSEEEEEVETTESTEEAPKEATKTLKLKDEYGEERDFTLDLNDEATLADLAQKAMNVQTIEQNNKALQDELASLKASIAEMQASTEESKSLVNGSFEDIINKKHPGGFDAWKKEQHDEIVKMMNMSEDEVKDMQRNKELDQARKREKELADKVDNVLAQLKEKEEAAAQRELDSWFETSLSKHSFNKHIEDANQAAQYNEFITLKAQRELGNLQKTTKLTPEIIDREVKKAFMALKSNISKAVDTQTTKKISEQKKAASEAATTVGKGGQAGELSLEQEVKNLFAKGKTGAIMKMAKSNPKVVAILEKLTRNF